MGAGNLWSEIECHGGVLNAAASSSSSASLEVEEPDHRQVPGKGSDSLISAERGEEGNSSLTGGECESGNMEGEDLEEKCGELGGLETDLWSKLPEELLDKIIARLPFRFLFQSRAVSKSWNSRMSCWSFQREVSLVSMSSWSSYCPLYVGNEGLMGYDSNSRRCEKLLTLSYLPNPRAALITNTRGKISACGPLLCFVDCDYFPNIYVTNVITRAWRILPSRPNMTYPAIVHLCMVGSDAYKVILVTPLDAPCSQIYDSVMGTWTIRYSEVVGVNNSSLQQAAAAASSSSRWVSSNRAWISSNNAWTNSAYLNGVLYVLWGYQYDGPCELLAYNVEEETWANIRIAALRPSQLDQFEFVYFISMSRILVCGDSVMVVIRQNITSTDLEGDVGFVRWRTGKENLVVFRLDTETRQIREVSRGPAVPLTDTDLNEAASDNENIYFYQKLCTHSSVVGYNVKENRWKIIPHVFDVKGFHDALKKRHQPQQLEFFFQPTTFSFQPGMNPFVEV